MRALGTLKGKIIKKDGGLFLAWSMKPDVLVRVRDDIPEKYCNKVVLITGRILYNDGVPIEIEEILKIETLSTTIPDIDKLAGILNLPETGDNIIRKMRDNWNTEQ